MFAAMQSWQVTCAHLAACWSCLIVAAEQDLRRPSAEKPLARPVVRIGCAGWQKAEMPFESFIAAYQQLHPELDIQLKVMPPEDQNKLMMLWMEGRTPLDAVLGLANEEIYTYIQMGVLEDVQNLLTPEQMAGYLPASLDGPAHRSRRPHAPLHDPLHHRDDVPQRPPGSARPARHHQSPQHLRRTAGPRQPVSSLQDSTGRKVWPVCIDFSQYVFFGQNAYVPDAGRLTRAARSPTLGAAWM